MKLKKNKKVDICLIMSNLPENLFFSKIDSISLQCTGIVEILYDFGVICKVIFDFEYNSSVKSAIPALENTKVIFEAKFDSIPF